MITPITNPNLYIHKVTCLRDNKGYTKGNNYEITCMEMTGKIYSDEKDSEGKWVDKVGVRDSRIMVMSLKSYKVFDSIEEVNDTFQE